MSISIDLNRPLGQGTDGAVWKSDRDSAIKALERERNYRTELECYQRFTDQAITTLHGFSVPRLLEWNDDLLIIEMGIVTPPFVLDFAKAWLDIPPEFSDETWADWEQDGKERFEHRWPQVLELLLALKQYGIYYYDAKPANINFGDAEL